jgi:hypothetical protein
MLIVTLDIHVWVCMWTAIVRGDGGILQRNATKVFRAFTNDDNWMSGPFPEYDSFLKARCSLE